MAADGGAAVPELLLASGQTVDAGRPYPSRRMLRAGVAKET
jgi:hypothetical protein